MQYNTKWLWILEYYKENSNKFLCVFFLRQQVKTEKSTTKPSSKHTRCQCEFHSDWMEMENSVEWSNNRSVSIHEAGEQAFRYVYFYYTILCISLGDLSAWCWWLLLMKCCVCCFFFRVSLFVCSVCVVRVAWCGLHLSSFLPIQWWMVCHLVRVLDDFSLSFKWFGALTERPIDGSQTHSNICFSFVWFGLVCFASLTWIMYLRWYISHLIIINVFLNEMLQRCWCFSLIVLHETKMRFSSIRFDHDRLSLICVAFCALDLGKFIHKLDAMPEPKIRSTMRISNGCDSGFWNVYKWKWTFWRKTHNFIMFWLPWLSEENRFPNENERRIPVVPFAIAFSLYFYCIAYNIKSTGNTQCCEWNWWRMAAVIVNDVCHMQKVLRIKLDWCTFIFASNPVNIVARTHIVSALCACVYYARCIISLFLFLFPIIANAIAIAIVIWMKMNESWQG